MQNLKQIDKSIYRAQFVKEEEVIEWLHDYEEESATSWRVKSALKSSVRFLYR